MSRKNTTVRSSAAVTAALLMTALTAGPAMADHDHGQGKSRDGVSQSAAHRQDGDRAKDRGAAHADRGTEQRARNHAGGRGEEKVRGGEKARGDERGNGNERGNGDERGNGHTPVTVCHLLGNGGYHLLTMDDNALSAHLRHGDVYPDDDGTCPAASAPAGAGTQTGTSTTEATTETTTEKTVAEQTTTAETTAEQTTAEKSTTEKSTTETDRTGAVVRGEEAFARTRTHTTVAGQGATVAGVEASRGANRAAPVAGPAAGILPQTGAGAMLFGALAAGAGLVAGGVALAARRRQGAL